MLPYAGWCVKTWRYVWLCWTPLKYSKIPRLDTELGSREMAGGQGPALLKYWGKAGPGHCFGIGSGQWSGPSSLEATDQLDNCLCQTTTPRVVANSQSCQAHEGIQACVRMASYRYAEGFEGSARGACYRHCY